MARYFSRRKPRTKRRYRKRLVRPGTRALRIVKKLMKADSYHYRDDADVDMFEQGGTPSQTFVEHITDIATGDDASNRQGRSITVNSVLIDGVVNTNGTATHNQVHVALIVDRQQVSDTSPTYGGVFDTVDNGNNQGIYTIRRTLGVPTPAHFQVLAQRVITVDDNSTSTKRFRMRHVFKKGLKVDYNGNQASDIERNGLYVIAFCDGNSATTVPIAAYSYRVSFLP